PGGHRHRRRDAAPSRPEDAGVVGGDQGPITAVGVRLALHAGGTGGHERLIVVGGARSLAERVRRRPVPAAVRPGGGPCPAADRARRQPYRGPVYSRQVRSLRFATTPEESPAVARRP